MIQRRHSKQAAGFVKRESLLEAWCREYAIERGFYLLKWVSPGTAGVPDRMLLMPGGKIVFIEFKRTLGKTSPTQLLWHERLRVLGFDVLIVKDKTTFAKLCNV